MLVCVTNMTSCHIARSCLWQKSHFLWQKKRFNHFGTQFVLYTVSRALIPSLVSNFLIRKV